MSQPTERQLSALRAIQADDQGQDGNLNIFDARECEDKGWAVKAGDTYRLTNAGQGVLGTSPQAARRG